MPRPAFVIQDEIAQAIVGAMSRPWKRIVLNYEIDDDEEQHSNSIFFHIFQDPFGDYRKDGQVSLPD